MAKTKQELKELANFLNSRTGNGGLVRLPGGQQQQLPAIIEDERSKWGKFGPNFSEFQENKDGTYTTKILVIGYNQKEITLLEKDLAQIVLVKQEAEKRWAQIKQEEKKAQEQAFREAAEKKLAEAKRLVNSHDKWTNFFNGNEEQVKAWRNEGLLEVESLTLVQNRGDNVYVKFHTAEERDKFCNRPGHSEAEGFRRAGDPLFVELKEPVLSKFGIKVVDHKICYEPVAATSYVRFSK